NAWSGQAKRSMSKLPPLRQQAQHQVTRTLCVFRQALQGGRRAGEVDRLLPLQCPWQICHQMPELQVDATPDLRSLPRSTDEQYREFARHVAEAHSWYKHLPSSTGGQFVVFLAPDAGAGRLVARRTEAIRGDGVEVGLYGLCLQWSRR